MIFTSSALAALEGGLAKCKVTASGTALPISNSIIGFIENRWTILWLL